MELSIYNFNQAKNCDFTIAILSIPYCYAVWIKRSIFITYVLYQNKFL